MGRLLEDLFGTMNVQSTPERFDQGPQAGRFRIGGDMAPAPDDDPQTLASQVVGAVPGGFKVACLPFHFEVAPDFESCLVPERSEDALELPRRRGDRQADDLVDGCIQHGNAWQPTLIAAAVG